MKVLEAYREERDLFVADKERVLTRNYEEAVLREMTPLKEQISALKDEVKEKELLVADSKKRAEAKVEFVSNQLKEAITMQGADLVSITSPQLSGKIGRYAAINSSIVSHLSVDDSEEDDDGDEEEEEEEEAEFIGSRNEEESKNAGIPDTFSASKLTSRSGEILPPDANVQTPTKRDTVMIGTGSMFSFPKNGSSGHADADPVDEALMRQAELMQEVEALKQKLAKYRDISPAGKNSPTNDSKRVSFDGDVSANMSSRSSSGSQFGESADSRNMVVLDALLRELESTRKELWDSEVKKNSSTLKLAVVERKYQQIIGRMERKIESLKDVHNKAKEIIQQEHGDRLDQISQKRDKEVETLKKAHDEVVKQVHSEHENALDEFRQREEKTQLELEQERKHQKLSEESFKKLTPTLWLPKRRYFFQRKELCRGGRRISRRSLRV